MNIRLTAIAIILAVSTPAVFAQTSDASAGSQSQSGATATQGNAQIANYNSPAAPDHVTVRNNPGVYMGGFAAPFSPDACSGTSQLGVSVIGASATAGKQVLEENCAHIRRAYAWMSKADYAYKTGRPVMASRYERMSNLALCDTGDENEQDECSRLRLTVDLNDNGDGRLNTDPLNEETVVTDTRGHTITVSPKK